MINLPITSLAARLVSGYVSLIPNMNTDKAYFSRTTSTMSLEDMKSENLIPGKYDYDMDYLGSRAYWDAPVTRE